MRNRIAAALVVFGAAGTGSVRGAAADEVVVLHDGGPGLLVRSDAPEPPPHTIVATPITGLEDDERVLAIDTRPGTGMLYGFTSKRVYAINLATGAATPAGPRFGGDLSFTGLRPLAFDVNPVTGVGRIIRSNFGPGGGPFVGSSTAFVDLDTGKLTDPYPTALDDPPALAYVAGDVAENWLPQIGALGYAADVGTAANFTAFGIDTNRIALVRLGTAGGVAIAGDDDRAVTTIASLGGLPFGARPVAFEVGADGAGMLLARGLDGDSLHHGLFRVDLATGETTLVRDLKQGLWADVAILPTAVPEATRPLEVTKAVVRRQFRGSRRTGDTIEMSGTMAVPTLAREGRTVRVDVGGVIREFTLDTKGRGRSGSDTFRLPVKAPGGVVHWSLVVKKGDFGAMESVDSGNLSGSARVLVDVFIDAEAHRTTLDLAYVVRKNGSVASLAKN